MRMLIALLASTLTAAADLSHFNGAWRQQIPANSTKARKPKELLIRTDGTTVAVKMMGSGKVASVDVTFQIGGPAVTYIGLDGDQFKLKAAFDGADLMFDGTEWEDGRVLTIHEVWTIKTQGEQRTLVDSRSTNDVTKTTIYEQSTPPSTQE